MSRIAAVAQNENASTKGPLGIERDVDTRAHVLRKVPVADLLARGVSIEPDDVALGIIHGIANRLDVLAFAVAAAMKDGDNDPMALTFQTEIEQIASLARVAAEAHRRTLEEATSDDICNRR